MGFRAVPLVVDRVSLSRAADRPKSVCTASPRPTSPSISLETLKQHGLVLVAFPNALLITTETSAVV